MERYLNKVEKLTPADRVNAQNVNAVKEELKDLDSIVLDAQDQFKFDTEYKDHVKKLKDVRDAVAKVEKEEADKKLAEEKTALQDSIKKAEEAKKGVKESKDGKDVAKTEKWATKENIETFDKAINAAKEAEKKENGYKEAKETLDKATKAFNDQVKAGTKEAEAPEAPVAGN